MNVSNRKNSMNANSNRCKPKVCTTYRFQSYNVNNFGQDVIYKAPISCALQKNCSMNQYQFNAYVMRQQNLYTLMRRFPWKFPLIPWVSKNGLTPAEQRQYSNLWYRQFGTSQAMPANDDWGGFYCPGSEVPYTN